VFNCRVTTSGQPSITVDEVTPELLLLDVREDEEWAAGHIEGAQHLPMGQVPAAVAAGLEWLVPERPVVVVCAVGARSARVAAWLNSQGYHAINLAGGMHAWADARRPFVSETGAAPTVL
jgi:rhodanese-related sulfurtransferase